MLRATDGHRPVVLLDRAELDQLNRLERLDEVARAQVVGLAGAHDLVGRLGVGDAEGALEQVAPVVALAAVVGQPLERRLVGREVGGHRLERDAELAGVDRAALVLADDRGVQVSPRHVHG